ncbi:MAG: MFS transporter [Thermoplasmatales archaeon]
MNKTGNEKSTFTLAYFSTLLDGYNLTVSAPLIVILSRFMNLSLLDTALLASSALIGNAVGGFLMGRLPDRFSRKTLLIVDLLLYAVMGLFSSLSITIAQIIIFRMLLGIGIGGDYPNSSSLLAEIQGNTGRGKSVGFLGTSWTIGFGLSLLVGLLLYPLGPDAWRILLFLPVISSVVIIILRSHLNESTPWKKSREVAKRDNVRRIFSKELRVFTIYVTTFWFFFDAIHYGISEYAPLVMKTIGLHGNTTGIIASLILASVEVIGTLVGISLVDREGRRKVQIIGFLGISVSMLVAAFVTQEYVLIFVLFALGEFVGFGPGILEFIYPPEMFPTELRGTGAGFANSMSGVGAVIGVLIQPFILGLSNGVTYLFLMYAGMAFAVLMLTIAIAPETSSKAVITEMPEIQ